MYPRMQSWWHGCGHTDWARGLLVGGAADVTAHQGRVTLSGSIAAYEVEKLLSAVASVAGVTASGQSPGSQPCYSVRRRRTEQ